jgi:hypothetical protein
MKKLAAVVLCAVFAFFAFGADRSNEPTSSYGTWKLDVKKSDYSKNPDGAPREAALTVTENGWTYASTDAKGKKEKLGFDGRANAVSGDDNISIKYEPTMNPSVSDMRISLKDSGKEVTRIISTVLPDSNTLVMYSSGVNPDGKQYSDVSYFKRVK